MFLILKGEIYHMLTLLELLFQSLHGVFEASEENQVVGKFVKFKFWLCEARFVKSLINLTVF